MTTQCTVSTPQFTRNRQYQLIQTGYIDTETWIFKGDQHTIYFHTEEEFIKYKV